MKPPGFFYVAVQIQKDIPQLLIAPFLIAFLDVSAPLPHIAEVANYKSEMDFRYRLSALPLLFLLPRLLLLALCYDIKRLQ